MVPKDACTDASRLMALPGNLLHKLRPVTVKAMLEAHCRKGGESAMNKLLRWTGRSAGVVGILLCAGSVVARAAGMFVIGSFQVGTLLQAGMAMMILGCLAYLAVLVDGARD
jgi:hypothetical protein